MKKFLLLKIKKIIIKQRIKILKKNESKNNIQAMEIDANEDGKKIIAKKKTKNY